MKKGLFRLKVWRWPFRLFSIATAFGLLWVFAVWPLPAWYRSHWPEETAFMERRRLAGTPAKPHQFLPLSKIDGGLVRAVVLGEDHRFWEHGGLDYIELRNAVGYKRSTFRWTDPGDDWELFRSVGATLTGTRAVRGASTITQQLAKNLYLSPSRNPFRKIKEAVTAYRLEQVLGKERILELYLNIAELGEGIWGVDAASRTYFGRPATRLSRDQAAALAATLPHPTTSNPGYRPGRMRWRQRLLLDRMRQN